MRAHRIAVALLLASWCVLGVIYTVRGLRSPAGWRAGNHDSTVGPIGMHLPGAGSVTSLRRMLERIDPRKTGPYLVILPRGAGRQTLDYVHAQLAYFRYPQRVDVVAMGQEPPLGYDYAGIVATPEVVVLRPWRRMAERADFVLYVRGGS